MLKKEKMIPGSFIKLRAVLKNGLPAAYTAPGEANAVIKHVSFMPAPGAVFDGIHPGYSGEIFEVVRGPKRKTGINCAIVRRPNIDIPMYAFWCELRASADHYIPPSP